VPQTPSEPDFAGTVGRTVGESTPHWPAEPGQGRARPDVVVVLLDDVGFGQLGCYGAPIDTPHVDALAGNGVRFTNFHATAMCSPTRASLLTGRNHHSVGVGYLADFDTGFPGYRGRVSPRAATVAEVLRGAGYGTYALGKWHLAPPGDLSSAGPFRHWPTGRGFDRFFGFLWGEDDQYAPELWEDQGNAATPRGPRYHLSEDLVDRAIGYLGDHLSATPDRPFFLYLAFGACHAPHQAPARYIERYRGAFDAGWDAARHAQLRRQIDAGLVPAGTQLPPSNPDVPAWSDLDPEEQRLCSRMQEVFAGFMTHTDHQIGRLVAFLREQGRLDDTLLVLLSDNGASGEGGRIGSANEYRYFLGQPDERQDTLDAIDALGGPQVHNHYPAGWAQAGNTPFRFYKKHTYAGGTRVPFIVHRPAADPVPGRIRHEFRHVTDVVPTILAATGVEPPAVHHGVPQIPVHGRDMQPFADPAPRDADRTQYFEMGGNRALWQDGWKAVTNHVAGRPYDLDRWALYDVRADPTETADRSPDQPERLARMVDRWWAEAERFQVLPLDDRAQARAYAGDPHRRERSAFRLLPGARQLTSSSGPDFAARPFVVEAHVHGIGPATSGTLLSHGRRPAGFVLFVQDGRLVFDYNVTGRHTVVTGGPVEGAGVLGVEVADGTGGATATLRVDGVEVARADLPSTFPAGFGCLTTQVGTSTPSPVTARLEPPADFTAGLRHVVVRLGPQVPSAAGEHYAAAVRAE
jgi:arylsulfatase A-like enzyme